MSVGHDKPEADLKGDFKAPNEKFDKNTVLNSSSQIDTLKPKVAWDNYGKTLEQLVEFRGKIDVGAVRNLETGWKNHGENLTKLANKFSDEVKANIKDSWDSDGGAVASTAVQRYADQLSQLSVVINGVVNSLHLAGDFLDATQKAIPDQKGLLIDGKTDVISKFTYADHSGSDDHSLRSGTGDDYAQHYDTYDNNTHMLVKQQLEKRANDVMNQVFVPGAKSVDAAMPMFPLPVSVTQGLPDPTGKPTDPGIGPGITPGAGPSLKSPSLTSPSLTSPSLTSPSLTNPAMDALQQRENARQAEYAKQQEAALKQQQDRAAQEQQQQQTSQVAQQGLQAAQQAAQQGLQAAQQLTKPTAADAAKDLANDMGLAGMADSALAGLGKGGLGGGLGAALNGAKSSLLAAEEQASKLFPRVALAAKAEEAAVEEARAGLASSGGMGSMGGMGAAGRGQQEKDKEKKRAEFLDSEEWLEQAMGDAPVTSKPVVDG
jgi:hypothetical protein